MAPHPLLETVNSTDAELRDVRQEAATKYAALQAVQREVAEATAAGTKIDTEHPLYTKLDDAGKAYGELSDRITALETTKATLVAQMGQTGIQAGGDGGSSDDYIAQLRANGAADGFVPQGGQLAALLRGLAARTPGQRVTDSDEWKQAKESGLFLRSEWGQPIPLGEAMDRDELRAALITGADSASAGAFVTPDRQGYYPLPLRPFTVLDLITIGETDSDLVEYVKMLTFTNAAAETPEAVSAADIGDGTGGTTTALLGGLKPESAMTFGVVQEAVKTLAHLVPATRRSLADAGQLRTIIDGLLRWGLGDRLERQVVAGDGAGENLRGILNITGTNAIPAGAKSHADKVHNAITANRLDGFVSTGVIMNPLDAETVWLSREDGTTGGYLFGNPNNPGPRTLWGLPVAETPACPQGTAIVGALRAYIFWLREGAQVLASDSHKDWFGRNIIAVLAEMRGAGGLPTPEAISEVNLAAA